MSLPLSEKDERINAPTEWVVQSREFGGNSQGRFAQITLFKEFPRGYNYDADRLTQDVIDAVNAPHEVRHAV